MPTTNYATAIGLKMSLATYGGGIAQESVFSSIIEIDGNYILTLCQRMRLSIPNSPCRPLAPTQMQQRNGGIPRFLVQDSLAAGRPRAYLPCQRDQNASQAD